jgi:hypothetical protein
MSTAAKIVKTPRALVAHRLVFALLALNFLVPAVSYIVDPATAEQTLATINQALGGAAMPAESGHLWHMLAVGNVMTLGFLCALLLVDLERFWPALPGLCFLKGFSAFYSLALGLAHDMPGFLAVFVLDGTSTVAMWFFASRAHRALQALPAEERPLPLWWYALFLDPERVRAQLRRVERAAIVERTPTLFQTWQGVARMWLRVMFRPNSVGMCADYAVRDTWRARALRFRFVRFFFLVRERAIAPFDMSGLISSRERIIRHLLGAHHDGPQFVYDLELLALEDGALEELRARAGAVVDGTDPRADWLRDLVVFERYHELLLERTERALAGDLGFTREDRVDPDITLRAFLDWCAFQPASPRAMLARLTTGAGDEPNALGTGTPRAL